MSQDWLDEDEYPSDRDEERFGEDSPLDYDPLTIGYVGEGRPPFWTRTRVIVAVIAALLLFTLVILPLLSRLA